ncbi:MAG TPA: tyrosine-type recombinase/integrase [Blastocatellia bacterium]|nr:tyrosine-type recombinase/integrase [Blastocatellia bacterium]
MDQGLVEANPCGRVKRLRETAHRNRYLTPEEEGRLMSALTGSLAFLRPIVVLALATGMQRGEIYGLRWEQVDFGRGMVTIPQTKSGRVRVVPRGRRWRPSPTTPGGIVTRLSQGPARASGRAG